MIRFLVDKAGSGDKEEDLITKQYAKEHRELLEEASLACYRMIPLFEVAT